MAAKIGHVEHQRVGAAGRARGSRRRLPRPRPRCATSSVTCAPASASAEAAASPMPRPAPVTSARLPSRRNEGAACSSTVHRTHSRRLARRGRCARHSGARARWPARRGRRKPSSMQSREQYSPIMRAGLVGQHLLVGAGLHELADPQPAGVARRLLGRQRVVGADHLVAIGDVGARAEEQRAVVLHAVEEHVRIARHHLHVLGGDAVGLGDHLGLVGADDHLAVILPGLAGRVGGREDLQQPLDLRHGVARELLGIGDQHGRRGRSVLGLAEQVGRADLAVDASRRR